MNGLALSTVPISRNILSACSFAPPCSGPVRAPIADETIVYGSASVDPTTRPLNVEAFMVCSACRIRHTSMIRESSGSGSSSFIIQRKFAACDRSSRGRTGSSPCRIRSKAATMVGILAIRRIVDQYR